MRWQTRDRIAAAEGADKQHITLKSGHKMAYLEAGDRSNPPLVMIHGWLSHAGFWRTTMDGLSDRYYCLAIDLLGHGHSDKPGHVEYTISAAGTRVMSTLEALGIDKFALIGHSMGGTIGQYLAAYDDTQRMTHLINVAGVTTGRLSRYVLSVHQPIVWFGHWVPVTWDGSRIGMRYGWYRQLLGDNILFYERGISTFASADVQMALVDGIHIPAYKELKAIKSLDLTPMLKNINAPTLILFGQQDNTVPMVNGQVAAEHIPNNKFIVWDKCGHCPMIEKYPEYITAVREFLMEQ